MATVDRGRAVVATAQIAAGSLVFEELPVLLLDVAADSAAFIQDTAKQFFELPSHQQESVLDLCKSQEPNRGLQAVLVSKHEELPTLIPQHSEARETAVGQLAQVVDCNLFAVQTDEGKVMGGLYALCSRVNHCCRPNMEMRFEGPRLQLWTKISVEADEELTVSYLDDAQLQEPTYIRRPRLQELWGFHCNCLRCAGGGSRHVVLA